MNKSIEETYKKNIAEYSKQAKTQSKKLVVLSFIRLISFIGIFLIPIVLIKTNTNVSIIISFGFLTLFIYSIKAYNKIKTLKDHYNILIDINLNEIKALKGNYEVFNNGDRYIDSNHGYTFDLDVFGNFSLFQYLNRTCTAIGENLLSNWLSNPLLEEKEILKRQKAINELKNKLEWRQNFIATGLLYETDKENDEKVIFDWLDEKAYFSRKIIYKSLRFIFPLITFAILMASIFHVTSVNNFFFIFILNLTFSYFEMKKINTVNEKISRRLDLIKKYSNLTKAIENEGFSNEYLNEIKNLLWYKNQNSSTLINKLSKLLNGLEGKNNVLAGIILNGLFSWNIQYLISIEKWKLNYKNEVINWLTSIKKIDALISLSNYTYNNPNYVFPDINKKLILDAKNTGHPLIINKNKICNDFIINNENEFIIITGPNMAGKSTFLRTIGVNLILAMAGAPVCASKFEFTPLNVLTSMRTSDSLSKNESYFLAELLRLNYIINKLRKGEKALIILDEILKGTNIQDKQTGSKEIVKQLINLKSPGIIATHDLALGDLKYTYKDSIIEKSLEIEITNEEIIYNYKLQDGRSDKMNAMILMKQMGLITN